MGGGELEHFCNSYSMCQKKKLLNPAEVYGFSDLNTGLHLIMATLLIMYSYKYIEN